MMSGLSFVRYSNILNIICILFVKPQLYGYVTRLPSALVPYLLRHTVEFCAAHEGVITTIAETMYAHQLAASTQLFVGFCTVFPYLVCVWLCILFCAETRTVSNLKFGGFFQNGSGYEYV